MKTIACIIARTNSTRLPEKVLKEINGKKLIKHIIDRIKCVKGIDELYVATSTHEDDRILYDIAVENNIKSYRGSETSVIDRMLDIGKIENAENIIRITGDNVFTDPYILEETLNMHIKHNAEYSRAEYLPIGTTAEIIDIDALKRCYNDIDPYKSEYLFYYIFDPSKYKTLVTLPKDKSLLNEYSSLTVDTPNDLERTLFIYENIQKDIIGYLDIAELNSKVNIPHYNISKELRVKLPDKESMTYGEFRKIINSRIEKSIKVYY